MDKTTEREARKIIEAIISDTNKRKIALVMLAEGIREANLYGRDTWAVHILSDRCRLLVGHLIVFVIIDNRVWLSCDNDLLANKKIDLAQTDGWEWDVTGYPEYKQIPARNGYYSPSSDLHPKIWPEIRRLFFEAIYKAATGRAMDPRTPTKHSPGTLQYLRNTLEIFVPDPLYQEQ